MATGQRRTTEIGRGIFLVRYVGAEDTEHPPLVRIDVEPSSQEHVKLFLHPDHEASVLHRPGTCLVVRAMMPGVLGVEVEPQMNGSVAATVNIEPLLQGNPPSSLQPIRQHLKSHNPDELRVQAHIAGIGDVYANGTGWLAGPAAPSRIEGLSLEWATKPHGLDVCYSVRTAQALGISGREVDLGSFAGTRGRAMPLTGLMLELSGPEASRYQFRVEALFLGSPVIRASGQRVVLSGPTGREPLVGLRIALEQAAETVQQPVNAVARPVNAVARPVKRPASPANVTPRSSGRVRVFRSRSKLEQSPRT